MKHNAPLGKPGAAADIGEATELRGALPPSETDNASTEPAELRPEECALSRALKEWGPWKRWHWYRQTQSHDRSGFWGSRDSEENKRGRLPDEEGVQVPAVWVAELYTPSTVGKLLRGIRDLGWEHGRSGRDSLSKWMNDVREGRQAGWINLGPVSPPSTAHMLIERTAPLPPGVKVALPILISLTPSLTAFVIAFLFDENRATSLEVPLREEFSTSVRRDRSFRLWHVAQYVFTNRTSHFGRSVYNPDILRREAVKSRLQELESDCVKWVRDHLAGVFTSQPGLRSPTAALLVTERARPLSEEAAKITAFDGLAIGRNYDAWESDEWPGAGLAMPHGWDDEGKRLVFACRRRDAFPDSPGYHEPTSNRTIAQRADELIRGLLLRWALTCLLDRYHETLSVLRDRTANDGRYRPIRDLKELRSLARTTLYDIGLCTQEIVEFAESDFRYRYDVLEMSYASEVRGEKPKLLDELRTSQKMRARQIQRDAALLQSTLSISNDLSQTISNMRIQRLVVLLTVVSVGVALWAAFKTVT